MRNPFVHAREAEAWRLVGDAWARIALRFAARARACWARADAETRKAEHGARELARHLTKQRSDNALWRRIESELAADRVEAA